MDLQTRKIEFIQEFLKIQSEDVISKLENILKTAYTNPEESDFKPMTVEEFNERIDKSESNFENNQFKSSSDLLSKFE